MNGHTSWWKSFVIAALLSTIASLLIVAVGPGMTEPNEKAKGGDTADHGNSEEAQAAHGSGGNGGGNGNGNGNGAEAAISGASAGTAGGGGGDHDGDADSNPNTALEDSHDPEPDGNPSDNKHPSGKDRSGENGGSGNQGKSESNPDDSKGPQRCEGTCGQDDKPQAGGGNDRDDQDGNNGCGNDDDFDDDNNGWCGKPKPPVDPCPDRDPNTPGRQCNPPDNDCTGDTNPNNNQSCDKKVTICHRTGSATNPFVIITVSENALKNGHDDTHGDLNPVDLALCTPPPPDCTGDNNPNNNQSCNPVLDCTGDTNPNNNGVCTPVPDCTGDFDPNNNQSCFPTVCPADSDLPGQPLPGGDIRNCFDEPPVVCPVGSNLAGQPVPDGNVANCFTTQPPPPVCPDGTDLAGQPIPLGNITLCDEEVLGDLIRNDGDVEGNMQERPAVQGGRILPFTGASILGYLLVGMELMIVGLFALRARSRRRG